MEWCWCWCWCWLFVDDSLLNDSDEDGFLVAALIGGFEPSFLTAWIRCKTHSNPTKKANDRTILTAMAPKLPFVSKLPPRTAPSMGIIPASFISSIGEMGNYLLWCWLRPRNPSPPLGNYGLVRIWHIWCFSPPFRSSVGRRSMSHCYCNHPE